MESIVIGVAGGSGSGKSTFTNRIKDYFGDDVVVLYHDNYYRKQDGIPFEQRVTVNYDHPDSLETELLVEHLKQLKEGKSIECPVYDYTQHNRSREVLKIDPKPVILVEGILLLADPRVRDLLDIKIYVEAKRSLIYSVNKDFCKNKLKDKWTNFLTVVPLFEGNDFKRKYADSVYKQYPFITFGVTVNSEKFNSILYCMDYFLINKMLEEIINTYIRILVHPIAGTISSFRMPM